MQLVDPVPHLSKAKCPPLTKQIKKLGTIRMNVVEATPVVWKGQLLRFEWARNHHNDLDVGCYRFVDMDSDETVSEFAPNHGFGCCYCENDVMYVHGMRGPEPDCKDGFWAHGPDGSHTLDVLWSDDLQNWHQKTALTFPDSIKVFNTSVCKGRDGYIMAIEIGGDDPIVGNAFTCVFARSDNLLDWELLPPEIYNYDRSRYTACPVIRYVDGYYYLICLESLPAYR
ncbi:MAG: hypothetical protein IJC25_05175 [Clostridia bacterium]|nr:hypothetical protein [Clostridia bacterium]